MAHSSSGLGRCPLKAEITGSNPVCATNLYSMKNRGYPGFFLPIEGGTSVFDLKGTT